jgi:hypothetical protein
MKKLALSLIMSGAALAAERPANPVMCGEWLNMKKEDHTKVNFVDGLIFGYQIGIRVALDINPSSPFMPYVIKKARTVEDDLKALCGKNPKMSVQDAVWQLMRETTAVIIQ